MILTVLVVVALTLVTTLVPDIENVFPIVDEVLQLDEEGASCGAGVAPSP